MTKQGAIKARLTSPDVCTADVNHFFGNGGRGEVGTALISKKMSNEGQRRKNVQIKQTMFPKV